MNDALKAAYEAWFKRPAYFNHPPSWQDAFIAGAQWACKAQREADLEIIRKWRCTCSANIQSTPIVVPSTEDV